MTTKDKRQMSKEVSEQYINIYSGILFNNQKFEEGKEENIIYKFDCLQFITLKEKYNIEEIAGKGSDFNRAKRLLHYFAPKLTH